MAGAVTHVVRGCASVAPGRGQLGSWGGLHFVCPLEDAHGRVLAVVRVHVREGIDPRKLVALLALPCALIASSCLPRRRPIS